MRKSISKEIALVLEGYKHISEMAGSAMFIHDTDGWIFDLNKNAEHLTGYTRGELLRMNVRDLHTSIEKKVSNKKLAVISRAKKQVAFESKFKRKNGRVIDVRIKADKFKFKKDFFIIGIVKDITAYKKFGKKRRKKRDMPKHLNDKFSKLLKHLGAKYIEYAHVLVDVAESRDPYTVSHSIKVTNYAVALARYIGLSKEAIEVLKISAILHDIGKIGVKPSILMKPSSLNEEEYKEVRRHPILSAEIIKPIKLMDELVPIIKHHHENYNGTGYPDGLKGEEIPLGARILSIADVYDALTTDRAYRKAYPFGKATKIMTEASGKKFDPVLLKAFMACLRPKKIR